MQPTLEEKVDKIFELVHAQNIQMAKHIVYQENHTQLLKEHQTKIEGLEGYKNKAIGVGLVGGITFGSVMGMIGGYIAKHF